MINKLLVILGPTATGKTDLAIKLAKIYHGELINCDSRQVYRGMDIGTGKDLPVSSKFIVHSSKLNNDKISIGYRKKQGIAVWLVDICRPDYTFNAGEYQKLARLVISDIQKRGKLPIIVGGTGLYVRSILEPLNRMQIPPNLKLRQQLNIQAIKQLQDILIRLNKQKFAGMNHSDQNNPRRLIRAIEIEEYQLKSSRAFSLSSRSDQLAERDQANEMSVDHTSLDFSSSSDWIRNDNGTFNLGRNDNDSPPPMGESLVIGLTAPFIKLKTRIEKRVDKRLKMGIIREIKNLLNSGYNWDLPAMSGLGYKEWQPMFSSSKFEVRSSKKNELIIKIIELWKLHELQYAKRQMTFFKKVPAIRWFDISKPGNQKQIYSLVNGWYNKLTISN